MDDEIRKAEHEGDEEKANRLRARAGRGRHATLIDQAVVIDGVRTSYRGILLYVLEVGGGVAILYFSKLKALESLADTNNEVEIGDFEVYSHAILGIGPMPKTWPAL